MIGDVQESSEELQATRRLVESIVERVGIDENRVWSALSDSGLDLICAVGVEDLSEACQFAFETVRGLAFAGADVGYADRAVLAPWTAIASGIAFDFDQRTVATDGGSLTVSASNDGFTVSGRLNDVPWGQSSDRLLVLLDIEGRAALTYLPTAGLTVAAGHNMAGVPRDTVDLDAVRVSQSDVHVIESPYADEKDKLAARGALLRVVELSGASARVLQTTIAHLSVRTQFHKTLISLGPVRQNLAVMASQCQLLESASFAAQASIDDSERKFLTAAASAKFVAEGSTRTLARLAHQLHGAIGVTVEYPLERFTKRLWAWSEEFGNGQFWASWLACQLQGPPGPRSVWRAVTDGIC